MKAVLRFSMPANASFPGGALLACDLWSDASRSCRVQLYLAKGHPVPIYRIRLSTASLIASGFTPHALSQEPGAGVVLLGTAVTADSNPNRLGHPLRSCRSAGRPHRNFRPPTCGPARAQPRSRFARDGVSSGNATDGSPPDDGETPQRSLAAGSAPVRRPAPGLTPMLQATARSGLSLAEPPPLAMPAGPSVLAASAL